MSDSLTRDDVAKGAQLARLELTDTELDTYTAQLGPGLGRAADAAALLPDDVPPAAHPLRLANVLRPDVERPCAERGEVLSQAPAVEDRRFKMPAILREAP